MENMNDNIRDEETASLKDYINLVRNNLLPILIITLTGLAVAIVYALTARDIYKSSTSLKISKPQGSLLSSSIMPDLQSFTDDRFISTEIEIMKSYNIRSSVASALIDTFKTVAVPDSFYLILDHSFSEEENINFYLFRKLQNFLEKKVNVEQKTRN